MLHDSYHRGSYATHRSSYEEAMCLFPTAQVVPQNYALSASTTFDIQRLQRIQSLMIQDCINRNSHRYFVIQVVKHLYHPIASLASTSTHRVHHRYSEFRKLYDQLHDRTEEKNFQCAVCMRFTNMLTHDKLEPSRRHQLTGASPQNYARLEKLLSAVHQHVLSYAAANAVRCQGCESTVHLLAAFLKEEYQQSTGLI